MLAGLQHLPLNSHLNRIRATAEKACPLFNHTEETVEHHLFYCTKLEKDSSPRNLTHRTHLLEQSANLKTHFIFTICHWAEGQEPTSFWIAMKKKKKKDLHDPRGVIFLNFQSIFMRLMITAAARRYVCFYEKCIIFNKQISWAIGIVLTFYENWMCVQLNVF